MKSMSPEFEKKRKKKIKKDPDDIEIKAEIEAIGKRIDRIVETVEKFYPSQLQTDTKGEDKKS